MSLSRRGGALAAAALLFAAAFPAACGARRDETRLAALEEGIASAQASLAALSAGAPSAAPGGVPGLPPGPAATSPTAPFAPPFPAPSALAPPAPPALAAPRSPPAARFAAAGASGPVPTAAAELLGAAPEALLRWFGDPDLRRPEGDAEVMLFLGAGCALDVVLYAERGGRRVAHAAARADGPAAVTEADCLRRLGDNGGAGRAMAGGHTPRR